MHSCISLLKSHEILFSPVIVSTNTKNILLLSLIFQLKTNDIVVPQ